MALFRRKKHWKKEGDVYTCSGHGWGIDPPPRTLAYQYFNYKLLEAAVDGRRCARSLEIGCGWGGRTPWIMELSDDAHAIEPNREALKEAEKLYPSVTFQDAKAQQIPYPDSHFDRVVCWTVLQHIPPDQLPAAASEIQRVLTDDGTLLLFENTAANRRSHPPIWYRTRAEYEELFRPMKLTKSIPRESVSGQSETNELLRFD